MHPTAGTAVVKEKPKPNLITVTVAPEPPPEPDVDTTTPMDTSILKFSMKDMAKWGPWMLSRLQPHFPHLSAWNYVGFLGQMMGERSALFLRTKRAIILATHNRETMSPRPVVDITFLFKHHPNDQTNEVELDEIKLLLDRLNEWSCGLGARAIRVLHPKRCDVNFIKMRELLDCDEAKQLVKDLDR